MADLQPIIVKKIKKAAHGAHGGAWKVAYADFVTAMMAFFLLLWLLACAPKETLTGIADYFTPSIGLAQGKGVGFDGGKKDTSPDSDQDGKTADALVYGAESAGSVVTTPSETKAPPSNEVEDQQNFNLLQNNLHEAMHDNPEMKDFQDNILIDMTPEGMRIQLIDSENNAMFKAGTTILEPQAKKLLDKISEIIKYLPNYLSIAGHTTPTQAANIEAGLDNWSLSALRANVARDYVVTQNQIDKEQIAKIVGKSDVEPIDPEKPAEIRDNRISITLLKNSIMPYQKRVVNDKDLDSDPKIRNNFKKTIDIVK